MHSYTKKLNICVVSETWKTLYKDSLDWHSLLHDHTRRTHFLRESRPSVLSTSRYKWWSQVRPRIFNRATLMNIGFVQARSKGDFDCYLFHDVDLLPKDDRNFYVCSSKPRHSGGYLKKWGYKLVLFVRLVNCVFSCRAYVNFQDFVLTWFGSVIECG